MKLVVHTYELPKEASYSTSPFGPGAFLLLPKGAQIVGLTINVNMRYAVRAVVDAEETAPERHLFCVVETGEEFQSAFCCDAPTWKYVCSCDHAFQNKHLFEGFGYGPIGPPGPDQEKEMPAKPDGFVPR